MYKYEIMCPICALCFVWNKREKFEVMLELFNQHVKDKHRIEGVGKDGYRDLYAKGSFHSMEWLRCHGIDPIADFNKYMEENYRNKIN